MSDIEFAACRAAQAVFERAASCGCETRPTLTRQMVDEIQQDIVAYARL